MKKDKNYLKNLVKDITLEDIEKCIRFYNIKGIYNYSFYNTFLIIKQKGTIAQSYQNWKKLNRYVKKGEKSRIYIYIPIIIKYFKCEKCGRFYTYKKLVEHCKEKYGISINKKYLQGLEYRTSKFFSFGSLFDITQTEGEPLKYEENSIDVTGLDYEDIKEKISKEFNFDITEKPINGARGYCIFDNNKIVINELSNNTDRIKTLIHESAHLILDHKKGDKSKIEIEAEFTSYLVCKLLNLGTEKTSLSYIKGYYDETIEDKIDIKILFSTAERIYKTITEKTLQEVA